MRSRLSQLVVGSGRRTARAFGIFLLFYVIFGVILTIGQEALIYQPSGPTFGNCPALAQADTETYGSARMYVQTGERGMVVLYHGNAGSACQRAVYAERIAAAGFGFILVEYPGYGGDTVPPSHARMQELVADVIAYVRSLEPTEVRIIGESLGGGVAGLHVQQSPPTSVLLISPFASLRDIARRIYWFYPTAWLVHDPFDNVQAFAEFSGRVTILHGENDRLIPIDSSQKIYATLTTPHRRFVAVPGADHNNLFSHSVAWTALTDFLSEEIYDQSDS